MLRAKRKLGVSDVGMRTPHLPQYRERGAREHRTALAHARSMLLARPTWRGRFDAGPQGWARDVHPCAKVQSPGKGDGAEHASMMPTSPSPSLKFWTVRGRGL